MEIHPQSPLNLLSELLIPILPEEVDNSEIYVLKSFVKKISDYGWFSGNIKQLYFYKSSIEKRDTLLYQISKNFRLELIGSGHNFRFVKEDLCISIPRKFYTLNHIYESFVSLINLNIHPSRFSLKSYFKTIESFNDDIKINSTSNFKIYYKLNERISLSISDMSDLFHVVIDDENSFFVLSHPKVWCETEEYWTLLRYIIYGFKVCK